LRLAFKTALPVNFASKTASRWVKLADSGHDRISWVTCKLISIARARYAAGVGIWLRIKLASALFSAYQQAADGGAKTRALARAMRVLCRSPVAALLEPQLFCRASAVLCGI
jgi:hypothetical protein